MNSEYAELKKLICEKGLLDKQPLYYTYKIFTTLGLLVASISILVLIDALWIQLLNAAFFSIVFVQIALVGHDAGHLQIFRSFRKSGVIVLVVNFLIGLAPSWWIDKHNKRHHANPNNVDLDLDVNIPLLAFTETQARNKRGFYGFVARYQAFFLALMLPLESISIRLDSIQYLLRGKNVKYPMAEPLLMAAHLIIYFGLAFYFLGIWYALPFIVVHQSLMGVYLGLIFATNHKGMVMVGKDNPINDFIRRQVLTSRNVRGNPLIDFLFGGLNYQIEHHLFPNMPRNNLKKARPIVKKFCEDRGITYCQVSLLRSYVNIINYLKLISASLRRKAVV